MNVLPQPIKLAPEDAKLLRDLTDENVAIEQFVAMVTNKGKQQMQELMVRSRTTWQTIEKKYGLDLQNVGYQPSSDGESIEPISMNLRKRP